MVPLACTSHEDCDDGVECTGDLCTIDGECANDLIDDVCVIDGVCVSQGTVRADGQCEICDTDASVTSWTPRQGEVCDDADPCTPESFCNKEVCEGTPLAQCCGNGVVEGDEICDGDCPDVCADGEDACATVNLTGSPETCDVTCEVTTQELCLNADACCPAGCSSDTDDDCESTCGDGVVDPGELCDGDCATECFQADPCTVVTMIGSPETCDVSCEVAALEICQSGDSCCPAGCTNDDDDDCAPACGNGVVDGVETCDGDCPTACFSTDPCVDVALEGSPATCDAACVAAPVTQCIKDDGCCPGGCTSIEDGDCALPYQCTVDIQVECVNKGDSAAQFRISVNAPDGYLEYNQPPMLFTDCGTPPIQGEGPCVEDCDAQGPLAFCDLDTGTCKQHQNLLQYCMHDTQMMLPLGPASGSITAQYWTGQCLVPEGGSAQACEATLDYVCP